MNKYGLNIIWSEEDQGYIVTCPEFPGLSAFGETFEDAVAEAKLAQELFIETYQAEGLPLPEPRKLEPPPNGQFRPRIPSNLYHQLTRIAELEGLSVNQFILMALSARVGGEQVRCKVDTWLADLEKRVVKRTAANNMEWVVALIRAWDRTSYAPTRQSGSTATEFAHLVLADAELVERV